MTRMGFLPLFCLALVSASSSGRAAERILLDRIGPSQATLYVAQADGSGEHALLPPGNLDYDPAWSPKGDWIAFTSERDGSAELYRVHPDGTGLERLTDNPAYDDQAAFSPDGKQVVFVSTRAEGFANLWILNLITHKARQLTTGKGGDFRPAWSPDGKWIAFSSDRDSDLPDAKGRWERMHVVNIQLIHPDGSGQKRLTAKDGNFCGSPKWTADSKSVIAYCMTGQTTWDDRVGKIDVDDNVQEIEVASGAARVLPAGPGVKEAPSPLASGQIGYLRRDKPNQGIFYAGGKTGPAGADIRVPSWSPDGKQLVFSRFAFPPQSNPAHMWSRNPKFDIYGTSSLSSVDAAHDRFATTERAGTGTRLVIGENGTPARTILERPDLILAPQWSADGKQIVVGVGLFSSFQDFEIGSRKPADPVNGGAQVAILNDDGGGFKLLTSGPNNNGFPSFAPDGKKIVYRTAGPQGEGLRILNLADLSVITLSGGWDNFPLWSPRGDLIAFVRRNSAGDFQIFTIHPDGTGLTQLSHTHGNDAHLAWSPDGEHLLFTSSRMGFKDEALYTGAPQPYGEIFVMRADGTDVQQLTDDQWEEGGPSWLPAVQKAAALSSP
jgi:Tol biopolymer transport system component